ncbi:MAG: hypothetical protein ACRDIE_15935 [Chloroflexota bacterium]
MSSLTLIQAQSQLDELRATTSPTDLTTPSPVVEVAVLSRHLRSALRMIGRSIKRADGLLKALREEGLLVSPDGRALGAAIQAERDRLVAVIAEYAPEEAYYWTPAWQDGEQEIERERLRGGAIAFADDDAFDAALRGR